MMLHQLKRYILRLSFVIPATVLSIAGYGQVLQPDQPHSRSLILAQEQFQQVHYTLAAQSCRQYLITQGDNISLENGSDAELAKFLIVVSSIKTNEVGSLKAGR